MFHIVHGSFPRALTLERKRREEDLCASKPLYPTAFLRIQLFELNDCVILVVVTRDADALQQ